MLMMGLGKGLGRIEAALMRPVQPMKLTALGLTPAESSRTGMEGPISYHHACTYINESCYTMIAL